MKDESERVRVRVSVPKSNAAYDILRQLSSEALIRGFVLSALEQAGLAARLRQTGVQDPGARPVQQDAGVAAAPRWRSKATGYSAADAGLSPSPITRRPPVVTPAKEAQTGAADLRESLLDDDQLADLRSMGVTWN